MSLIKILYFSLFLFTIGCATNSDNKRHQDFLRQVQSKRELLSPAKYKIYIKQMIDQKEGELTALTGQLEQSNKMMDHHDVMEGSTGRDTYSFNKTTTGMNLKKIDTRIRNVEKELYLLKSQLSRD